MQGKNTGEGQRWKTMECLNVASLGRSEDAQTCGLWFHERCLATAASEPSFYTGFILNTFPTPEVKFCGIYLLQR